MTQQATLVRPEIRPGAGTDVDYWTLDGSRVPLFVGARPGAFADRPAFFAWLRDNRSALDALLVEHGALVFRGFPVTTAEDFDAMMSLYPAYAAGYVGGASSRSVVTGKVMEATRLAPPYKIALHQEMAYLHNWPKRLAFFGYIIPEQGGETIIADMVEFTRRLPDWLREKLEAHGVRGVRNYGPAGTGRGETQHPDDKGWDEGFQTEDRAEVERICASMGMEPIWNDNGSLTVVTYTGGFADHPATGEHVYRSILHSNYKYEAFAKGDPAFEEAKSHQALPTGYAVGDGQVLTREEDGLLCDTLDDLTRAWKWQQGDVLLIDNLQVAHGRNPYVGDRLTLVALLD